MTIACGIDFGTSNSTGAVASNKNISLVTLEGDHDTLPSALFFPENGRVSFGRDAVKNYINGEEGRFMRGLKTILGTSLMQEKTRVNTKSYDFKDIVGLYLKTIKTRMEDVVGKQIDQAVLGRPVHFHDNNPDADALSENTLKEIGHTIGFKDISFQYEPIAAAFSHEIHLDRERLAIVVDIGGGTSDFTVIRLSPNRLDALDRSQDILATHGVRVGGTNFDHYLSLKKMMPHLGYNSFYDGGFNKDKILTTPNATYVELSQWSKVNFAQTAKALKKTKDILQTAHDPEKIEHLHYVQENQLGHVLLQKIEDLKISLSHDDQALIDLSSMGLNICIDATQNELQKETKTLSDKIETCLSETLQRANITKNDINLVILTGGSSRLKAVKDIIKLHFPAIDVSSQNSFSSVGIGLGHAAARHYL